MPESEEDKLKTLNRDSFAAEDQGSRAMMELILADDFHIVRNTVRVEEREAMLDSVASGKGKGRREVSDETVRVFGDRAVVASLIAFWRDNGDFVGRFWNTKVFSRQEGGGWRCTAWQVTKVH
jgi:Domain of unknown function (DUF4440)